MKSIILIIFFSIVMTSLVGAEDVDFVYDAHGKRDPMWSLVGSNGVVKNYETDFLITDLNLEGIVAGAGGKNIAMINGQIVKSNDKIGDFYVQKVGEKTVTLLKGEQTYLLKLNKED